MYPYEGVKSPSMLTGFEPVGKELRRPRRRNRRRLSQASRFYPDPEIKEESK